MWLLLADRYCRLWLEYLSRYILIISGSGNGTFKPNDPVTRAQFAAILRQAFLASEPATAQAFVDAPADYWAAKSVSTASNAFSNNENYLAIVDLAIVDLAIVDYQQIRIFSKNF